MGVHVGVLWIVVARSLSAFKRHIDTQGVLDGVYGFDVARPQLVDQS